MAVCLLSALPCAAQEPLPPHEQHPWAKFPIGSWKTVRVIGETLDVRGDVTNITTIETRSTLIEVSDDTYTLRVDVSVEVAGKRFPTQTQVVKHGYWGESEQQRATMERIGEAQLQLNGKSLNVEQLQFRFDEDGRKVLSTVHYSSQVPPYQLRRETVSEHETDAKSFRTIVEVVALELPHNVLGEIKSTTVVKTVKKHSRGTSVTVEMHCDDVPGGVVSHAAAEHDSQGEVTRRSTLQIVDYSIGVGRVEEPASVIRRRKYHRTRRRGEDMYRIAPPQR
jgi:hypothetical protein